MLIELTKKEIKKCVDFSKECAKNQQTIEFGEKKFNRSLREVIRDTVIGKLAELAFAKFMYQHYQVKIPLDFNFYPRGQWDKSDSEINGWRIDVKGTREGGRWFMLEKNKLNFRLKEKMVSHLYIMATVGWNRDKDIPTGIVKFEGFTHLFNLLPKTNKNLKLLNKGDLIPNTNTKLQTYNFAIHKDHLNKNWNKMMSVVKENILPNKDFGKKWFKKFITEMQYGNK